MRVTVRLFARQREIAGSREVALELPAPATIEDAWAALAELHPALAAGRPYVRFARNGEYADPTTPLVDGDQLACIPPVSGGAGDELGRAEPARILELRPRHCPPTSAGRWATGWRRRPTVPWSFRGTDPRDTGSARPRGGGEARRHAGSASRRSSTRPSSRSRSACSRRSPAPSRPASGCTGLHRPRHRRRAAGGGLRGHRRLRTPPGRGVRRARFAMDETKARAPIWKAERFADGHVWIGQPARTDDLGSTAKREDEA